MNKPEVIYVYDALCGWCFGFSGVIRKLAEEYRGEFDFTVISGGMMLGDREGILDPQMAQYILQTIPRLEEHTGVRFGESYKQQIAGGQLYQSSMKPSIALSVFKSYQPGKAVDFASDIQRAQFIEGKSLEDDATYLELSEAYGIPAAEFIEKLNSTSYREAAEQDFRLAHQLGVTGFPAVLARHNGQYYSLSRGYQSYENLTPIFERLKSL